MSDIQTSSNNTSDSLTPNGNQASAWYLLSLVVLLLDQYSKHFFLTSLEVEGNTISVIEPILNWTLAYNPGAAFSFLAGQSGWQKFFFSGLALVVSAFLLIYLRSVPKQAKILSFALACILGGAVGNLIDRMRFGYVIDFIHVHYENVWEYPIFNIADCAIVIGVIFMVYDMLFLENKRQIKTN